MDDDDDVDVERPRPCERREEGGFEMPLVRVEEDEVMLLLEMLPVVDPRVREAVLSVLPLLVLLVTLLWDRKKVWLVLPCMDDAVVAVEGVL